VTCEVLDARNLLCPLPVIRTQDAVQQLNAGDLLRVICTDPGALHDIPAWCRVHGHQIASVERKDREITIVVKVGDSNV
jgi:tRNA 2-thiouridine synthesizing protein A